MKNRIIKSFLNDNQGAVVSALVILIIPMIVIGMINLTESTNILRGSNTTLQNAITLMARQSAMMVNKESQAKADPLIAHKKAHDEFSYQLQATLGKDIDGLTTTIDVSSLKYYMLIYNGRNTYKGISINTSGKITGGSNKEYPSEVKSYAYYNYTNGGASPILDNTISGFPKVLFIGKDGIFNEQDENNERIKITIKEPGVLLVLNADINPIMTDKKENVTRWAYAKIVKK